MVLFIPLTLPKPKHTDEPGTKPKMPSQYTPSKDGMEAPHEQQNTAHTMLPAPFQKTYTVSYMKRSLDPFLHGTLHPSTPSLAASVVPPTDLGCSCSSPPAPKRFHIFGPHHPLVVRATVIDIASALDRQGTRIKRHNSQSKNDECTYHHRTPRLPLYEKFESQYLKRMCKCNHCKPRRPISVG